LPCAACCAGQRTLAGDVLEATVDATIDYHVYGPGSYYHSGSGSHRRRSGDREWERAREQERQQKKQQQQQQAKKLDNDGTRALVALLLFPFLSHGCYSVFLCRR
jgi:hypothetical protein